MKTRKLFAILLAATLLTACGNHPTESTAPTVSQQDSTSEETKSHTPKEDVIITIATKGELNAQLSKAVKTFNGLGKGYKIELKDYSQYYDPSFEDTNFRMGLDAVHVKMQLDIMRGTDIDIVYEGAFLDSGKFDIICHKGGFANLYSFMENDETFSKDSLNSHVLELHEIDGNLYSLPVVFQVETLKGDARYVGTKENWTLDELIEKWEQVPENVTFNGSMDKWYVYDDFMRGNVGQFIDYENATVSFDSPDFLRILKFSNSFPESDMYFSDAYAGMDRFVERCTISGFQKFHNQLWSMDGKDYTLVGYPSYDGNGAFINTSGFRYAICYKSPPEEQQGAWEFLKYLASESYQYDYMKANGEEVGFPINNAVFERLAEEALKNEGKPNIVSMNGTEIDLGYFSHAEYDRLMEYIANTGRITSNIDEPLWTIINEEMSTLFSGKKSEEEVAEAIQGRASIMVSEQS
ncbi:MAG: extracellular solute-binding protein [Oscillospiraceae bacterium]|nr:extracellular solute-binding protein [Oscillospiraceae bacterium]